jgi:hypothetical protein
MWDERDATSLRWNSAASESATVRIVRRRAALAAVLCVLASAVHAKVESVDLYERADVLGGQPFGDSGPYERLAGSIHFAFDPRNPANAKIVDLSRAPVRADGRVGATADFMVLRPKDTLKGRGIALLEVSNRAPRRRSATSIAPARAARPTRRRISATASSCARTDGHLGRLQFDVPDPRLLRMQVPIANDNGEPIYGVVRSDWVVDETVSTLALGHRITGLIRSRPGRRAQRSRAARTRREARDRPARAGSLPARCRAAIARPIRRTSMRTRGFRAATSTSWSTWRAIRASSGSGSRRSATR